MPGKFLTSKRILILNICLVSVLIGAALATAIHYWGPPALSDGRLPSQPVYAQDTPRFTESSNILLEIQRSFREVGRRALPVVVQINVTELIRQRLPEYFRPNEQQSPFEPREIPRPGLGSGVLVRQAGKKVYVLTNNHVVSQAEEISVLLYDQREFKAEKVGTDPRKDLALIVFETREDVPLAELGDSETLQVGDWVLAVGNPFGFTSSMTFGIVSAIGRAARGGLYAQFTDFIQTDAAINQGNSGGALVNLEGQVVGINSWIATATGVSGGVGFSIPINNVKQAIDELIATGRVQYGWLGVVINDLSAEETDDMRLKDAGGAFVFDVFIDSPAEKGGILPGDFITRVGAMDVSDSNELLLAVGKLTPNESVQFDIIRYGERITRVTRIGARQSEDRVEQQRQSLWPGFTVRVPDKELKAGLDIPSQITGVLVTYVESDTLWQTAGLMESDIVLEINGKKTGSLLEFYQALNSPSRLLTLRLYRDGEEKQLELKR